jgi:hypothetical protein
VTTQAEMTAVEFEATALLSRVPVAQQMAVRRVLVEGWTLSAAAAEAGRTRQALHTSIRAFRATHAELLRAQQLLRNSDASKEKSPGG